MENSVGRISDAAIVDYQRPVNRFGSDDIGQNYPMLY
jgi:hypothetical protein